MEQKSTFGIEDLVPHLNNAAQDFLHDSRFQTQNCKHILKALIIYVANTPVTAIANLFKLDSPDNESKIQKESWEYAFQYVLGVHFEGQENPKREDNFMSIPLPETANIMCQILRSLYQQYEGSNQQIRAVLGFWIAKLYMESIHCLKLEDLPETLRNPYSTFISLAGHHWHDRSISLPFNDPDLKNFGVHQMWFPSAKSDEEVSVEEEEVPEFTQSVPINGDNGNLLGVEEHNTGIESTSPLTSMMVPVASSSATVKGETVEEWSRDASTYMQGISNDKLPFKKRRFECKVDATATTWMHGIPDENLPLKKRRCLRD